MKTAVTVKQFYLISHHFVHYFSHQLWNSSPFLACKQGKLYVGELQYFRNTKLLMCYLIINFIAFLLKTDTVYTCTVLQLHVDGVHMATVITEQQLKKIIYVTVQSISSGVLSPVPHLPFLYYFLGFRSIWTGFYGDFTSCSGKLKERQS